MRLSWLALLIAVLISGNSLLPIPAAAQDRLPILGRENRFAGQAGSGFAFEIRQNTVVAIGVGPHERPTNPRVQTSATTAGVAIFPAGAERLEDISLLVVQTRLCESPGCSRSSRWVSYRYPNFATEKPVLLRPGRYEAVLVGEPDLAMVATLETSRPSGSTSPHPRSTDRVSFKEGQASSLSAPVGVFGEYASHTLSAPSGIAYGITWMTSSEFRGNRTFVCLSHTPEFIAPLLGGPQCYGPSFYRFNGGAPITVVPYKGGYILHSLFEVRQAMGDGLPESPDWTYSFSSLSPGPIKDAGARSLVLSL